MSEVWFPETVERIISETVNDVIGMRNYTDVSAAGWNNLICDKLIAKLVDLKRPCRYSVDSLVMEKNGAGLHSSTASFFENGVDGQITYLWPKEKSRDCLNKSTLCLITIFGSHL